MFVTTTSCTFVCCHGGLFSSAECVCCAGGRAESREWSGVRPPGPHDVNDTLISRCTNFGPAARIFYIHYHHLTDTHTHTESFRKCFKHQIISNSNAKHITNTDVHLYITRHTRNQTDNFQRTNTHNSPPQTQSIKIICVCGSKIHSQSDPHDRYYNILLVTILITVFYPAMIGTEHHQMCAFIQYFAYTSAFKFGKLWYT